jgi:uncharacterized membrane-anchored protein
MRLLLAIACLLPTLLWAQNQNPQDAQGPQAELRKLAWQKGPTSGRIAGKATLKVPEGYVFLDDKNTRRFLELVGNPPIDNHYLFAPDTLSWFAVFAFDDTGYIKDDERIDAEALLKQMKDSDDPANEERRRLGLSELHTVGWEVPPHYDAGTKRLEWGVRLRSGSGEPIVNYTSRLLGRSGVMRAVLVGDPATLAADTAQFKAGLQDFAYLPGEKYSEFKQGDKVAQYGLAALIVGGAAAVATKKGFWTALVAFFAAFWKLIAGVAVAVVAWIGSKLKGRRQTPSA